MNTPERPILASVKDSHTPLPRGKARNRIRIAAAGAMNQKPSQLRLIRSLSHQVVLRMVRAGPRPATLSVITVLHRLQGRPSVGRAAGAGLRGTRPPQAR